jgi:DNA-binding Lrp family transcriptional regulator
MSAEEKRGRFVDVLEVLRNKSRPVDINEIADELGLSVRSVRRRVRELEERGLVETKVIAGKKLYILKATPTLNRFMETLSPLTKVEEIMLRIKSFEKIFDKETQDSIREHILNTKPEEIKRELQDFLSEKLKALENKSDEESRRRRDMLQEHLRIVKSITIFGNIQRCEDPPLGRERRLVITGTDASRYLLEIRWDIGMVPIFFNLMILSSSAVIGEFENGFDASNYTYFDEPRFPISAGEMYIEELSTRYSNLDEAEKNILSMIWMNTTHYDFDRRVIMQWRPIIHFHDGRLLPPHMHYIDFYHEHRREALWRCFGEALNLKEIARRMCCHLVGVVKEPHPETEIMSKVVNMLLEKLGKNEYEKFFSIRDFEVMDLILEEGYASWITFIHPLAIYLPTSSEEDKAKKIFGEEDLERYRNHLKDSDYCYFYIKHAKHGIARYDFYKPENNDEIINTQNKIASFAHKLAVPMVGQQTDLGRLLVYVPNVVSFADDRAKMWAKSVATQLFHYLRTKLLRG